MKDDMRNIIDAIKTIVETHNNTTSNQEHYAIKINAIGEGLEDYVKDAFAGSFGKDSATKETLRNREFSYQGCPSNPPDIMIRGGDAIEVKKQEGFSAIPLNSSIPHQKLKSTDSRITTECKNSEVWTEKDMIYAVGMVKRNKVRHLSLVYGLDYCANEETYDKITKPIKDAIINIGKTFTDVHQIDTNELGKFKDIDPLKISDLRVRGMFNILNPIKVFEDVYDYHSHDFSLMCIINEDKLATFQNTSILSELQRTIINFKVNDIEIPNPDNITDKRKAKLITYYE